ncbi:uncharacterized protein SOCEGT47_056820 [Sorangium cellulosum]|uniref:Uncharacterized protein n=1 Tax=Sorangium cellulosum TaxID=56 RepID=A0A4P2Q7N4_SORCE|nr:hypothetical protein [Sorangium cellulosum]AUX25138.1 uncharacterized protein SOCEGT47_056820 [Sorangium cellulosum]
MRLTRGELVWAVRELKRTLDDVLAAFGAVLAVQRIARWRTELDARPPVDLDAEREALAACLVANELDPLLQPEDFGEPLHRSIAVALGAGVVTDELVHGEVIGYLRGLLRDHEFEGDATGAVLRVAALARQRRALLAVERARRELASPEGSHRDAADALRSALAHLADGATESGAELRVRRGAYTFRRRAI